MSPSPQQSPIMGARKHERHPENSPASQPHTLLSKKDRKRSLIRDSFSAIEEGFSVNKDSYYRVHLQKLQIDMNLIASADPHGSGLLPNDPAEIERLVRESVQPNRILQLGADTPDGAGKAYAEFAKSCNDAMEERDTALAILHRDISVKMTDIQSTYNYYKKLALNEHKALRTTLRDRLINSITNKKIRLTKEKEMDVSDSTALLLHPSQFGIANPSSPGGIPSKRTTRNRRDTEEAAGFADVYSRKRKMQDRDESPLSTRQRNENVSGPPSWQAEKNSLVTTQIESPLYSIDKLFTEKELSMTYNTAALAAYSYIVRHNLPENSLSKISSGFDVDKAVGLDEASIGENMEILSPVESSTERQTSLATRSTRGTYTSGFGIDAFDDLSSPSNFQILTRQIPKLPNVIPQLGTRSLTIKCETAPPAAGLSNEDINVEVELIRRARQFNDTQGLGRNLETDEQAIRLLSEAAFPKDGRGRERWVVGENRENLSFTQRSGRNKEHEILEYGEMINKRNTK